MDWHRVRVVAYLPSASRNRAPTRASHVPFAISFSPTHEPTLMLTIRSEQMRALQTARAEQFVQYTLARVPVTLPHLADAMPDWTTRVRPSVARGLRHFSAQDDVARYVEIVLRHLDERTADELPDAAREMIHSASLPAARRLDNFERWAKKRAVRRAV